MTEEFHEKHQAYYVTHVNAENVIIQENILHTKASMSLVRQAEGCLRSKRDWHKINDLLKELESLKIGAIKQFVEQESTSYVKLLIPQEGNLWIRFDRLKQYARACECKADWWFEQNTGGHGIKIHRVVTPFTNRQETVLKTFYNESVDGVISMTNNGVLQISHKNVLYVQRGLSSTGGVTHCSSGMNCPIFCEPTGVLGPLRIRVVVPENNMHHVHNTTPLPELGYTIVSVSEFEDECEKNARKHVQQPEENPNDALGVCTVNENGSITDSTGRVFYKKLKKNLNSKAYTCKAGGRATNATLQTNSRGQYVLVFPKPKQTIDVEELDTVTVNTAGKRPFIKYDGCKFILQATGRMMWLCQSMHGLKKCKRKGRAFYTSKGIAKFIPSADHLVQVLNGTYAKDVLNATVRDNDEDEEDSMDVDDDDADADADADDDDGDDD